MCVCIVSVCTLPLVSAFVVAFSVETVALSSALNISVHMYVCKCVCVCVSKNESELQIKSARMLRIFSRIFMLFLRAFAAV